MLRFGGIFSDYFSRRRVYFWVRRWKIENRPTFGKVMGKSRLSYVFFTHRLQYGYTL